MGAPNLDDPFFGALRALAADLQVPAAWLLLILWIESGLQTSPPHNARYPDYWGLNQMNGTYLRDTAKVDPHDYETWAASEQLSKVIAPWYKATATFALGSKTAPTAGVLYGVNFLPDRIRTRGTSDDTVLTKKGDPDGYYEANAKALDANGDGEITIGDLNMTLAKHASDSGFVGQLLRLGVDDLPLPEPSPQPSPAPAPTPPSSSSSSFPWRGVLLLVAAGALVGAGLHFAGARAPLTGARYW